MNCSLFTTADCRPFSSLEHQQQQQSPSPSTGTPGNVPISSVAGHYLETIGSKPIKQHRRSPNSSFTNNDLEITVHQSSPSTLLAERSFHCLSSATNFYSTKETVNKIKPFSALPPQKCSLKLISLFQSYNVGNKPPHVPLGSPEPFYEVTSTSLPQGFPPTSSATTHLSPQQFHHHHHPHPHHYHSSIVPQPSINYSEQVPAYHQHHPQLETIASAVLPPSLAPYHHHPQYDPRLQLQTFPNHHHHHHRLVPN